MHRNCRQRTVPGRLSLPRPPRRACTNVPGPSGMMRRTTRPSGWYCMVCMHRILTDVGGRDSAELKAFYQDLDQHLTLADELRRRAGPTPRE